MIFSLTYCFMVPQKDFRFFAPCSSVYQTTLFQRPSVRLKMFPFVSNFRCIVQLSFLSNTQYGNRRRIVTLNGEYPHPAVGREIRKKDLRALPGGPFF